MWSVRILTVRSIPQGLPYGVIWIVLTDSGRYNKLRIAWRHPQAMGQTQIPRKDDCTLEETT